MTASDSPEVSASVDSPVIIADAEVNAAAVNADADDSADDYGASYAEVRAAYDQRVSARTDPLGLRDCIRQLAGTLTGSIRDSLGRDGFCDRLTPSQLANAMWAGMSESGLLRDVSAAVRMCGMSPAGVT